MKEFLIDNWANILTVIVFITGAVMLSLRGKRGIVSEILFHLVTEAEKIYGSGTGQMKLAYVTERAYNSLPSIVRAFITCERLKELIESALARAKLAWARDAGIGEYLNKAA